MAVKAITPDYQGTALDPVENFHGNIMFHVNWEKHLMFCAPIALAMPPDTVFSQLVEGTLAEAYGYHPDMARVDWQAATWTKDNEPFEPDFDATLTENGVIHRTLLRFTTPGLEGIAGSAT